MDPEPEHLRTKTIIIEFTKRLADFGRVGEIRSANGPQYNSTEFKKFIKQMEITHKTSSPGYSRLN